MPVEVSRTEVRRLVERGAQLVEVLPEREYDDEHLPGAINIPLKKLDEARVQTLNRTAPIIVYCNDYQ